MIIQLNGLRRRVSSCRVHPITLIRYADKRIVNIMEVYS